MVLRKRKPLTIRVAKGLGIGSTEISAFDMSLKKAGIANYNLIKLSSVIPPKSKVKISEPFLSHYSAEEHGNKVYVVIAKQLQNEPGMCAYAGLGWIQTNKKNDPRYFGRGLFVEHEGYSEKDVATKINLSLKDMIKYRPEGNLYGKPRKLIIGGKAPKSGYLCAVVVAIYQTAGW